MNSNTSTPSPTRRRRFLWWFLGGTAFCMLTAVVAVASLFTLTRDAATLRDELLGASDVKARTCVQLSAGPVVLSAVRAALAFVPDMPVEARHALRAVRKASVGVYQLPAAFPEANRVKVIAVVDGSMQRRGWSRVVAVNDDALVLVYLPTRTGSGRRQKVCVAVYDDNQVVIVAGTLDIAPLAELAGLRDRLARL